jgi:hypothetical protein
MNAFLQSIKDPTSDQQKQMQKVLLGGRGQQKRLYSVDETIYGTEEGAKLQKEAQEKAIQKKQKKREKKVSSNEGGNNISSDDSGSSSLNRTDTEDSHSRIVRQTVAAVTVVGALAAAGASFLLGGKRS